MKSAELHARITEENSDFINEVAKSEKRSRSNVADILITEAKLARVNNRIKELKEDQYSKRYEIDSLNLDHRGFNFVEDCKKTDSLYYKGIPFSELSEDEYKECVNHYLENLRPSKS